MFMGIYIGLFAVVILSGCNWFENPEDTDNEYVESGYCGVIIVPPASNGNDYYSPTDDISILIIDNDLSGVGEIIVNIKGLSSGLNVDISLNEINPGVFTKNINLHNDYGLLVSDTIIITYFDDMPCSIKSANISIVY